MSLLIFLLLFIPLSLLIAAKVAGSRGDKKFLSLIVGLAWLGLGLMLVLVNTWMPFTGGGDDAAYFQAASAEGVFDFLDLTRFIGLYEQPGYPWLLSMLVALVGPDLLLLKALNIFFLVALALTWYRIGLLLEGVRFARRLAVAILLLSPLWFYVAFLLKDLTIALLQSLFLLLAVRMWQGVRASSVVGSVLVTLAVVPFRVHLVAQNGLVLVGSFLIRSLSRWRRGSSRVAPLALIAAMVALVAYLVTNADFLLRLGIYTEHRVFSSQMLDAAAEYANAKPGALFPALYLLSETSGLNPQTWETLDAAWLRGVLAIPWILFVVPMFLFGLRWLFRTSRAASSPWCVVLLFILSSMAMAWVSGDTTRWRVPDMPAIAAVAVAGWTYTSAKRRVLVLLFWGLAILAVFIYRLI